MMELSYWEGLVNNILILRPLHTAKTVGGKQYNKLEGIDMLSSMVQIESTYTHLTQVGTISLI